jgi:hypothetical protein
MIISGSTYRAGEGRPVDDVQAARVDGVAGEQDPGIPVVEGDRRIVVPGRAEAVEHAAAEVDLGGRFGLGIEAEIRPHRVAGRADQDGVGPAVNWPSPATWSLCPCVCSTSSP